ncbi:hypothetical protein SLEP1_g43145 [Rubroshorea leprosula]|uniref:Transposase n=1 Tax=Rubroshorea leprosula TaxID=152421 RepID=A0AAV5LC27_9ROSI|nr:hypothetical protein SLEP1_g43145 [Rubroshorea leprosula]
MMAPSQILWQHKFGILRPTVAAVDDVIFVLRPSGQGKCPCVASSVDDAEIKENVILNLKKHLKAGSRSWCIKKN